MTDATAPNAVLNAANAASPAQRQRSAALVVLLVALATIGALLRAPSSGSAPTPCDEPRIVDGVLTCATDGIGAAPGARAWLTGAKLDVNRATARELEAIPDIGPSLANAIVEERTRRGGTFASVEELDDVNGVGPKTLELLRAYVK